MHVSFQYLKDVSDGTLVTENLSSEEARSPDYKTVKLDPGREGLMAGAIIGSFVLSTVVGFLIFRRRESKDGDEESSKNYTEIHSKSWIGYEGNEVLNEMQDSYTKSATKTGRRSMSDLAIGATQEEFVQNGMRIDIYGSSKKKKKKRNLLVENRAKKGAHLCTELDPINEVDSARSSSCPPEERRIIDSNMLPSLDSSTPSDSDDYLPSPSISSNPSDENDEIFHHQRSVDDAQNMNERTDRKELTYAQFTYNQNDVDTNSPIVTLENIAFQGTSMSDNLAPVTNNEDEISAESSYDEEVENGLEGTQSPSVIVVSNQSEIPDSPFMSTNPMVVVPVGDEQISDEEQNERVKRKLSF